MRKGKVSSITRLRINDDGPGVRSVIFMYGCPLECAWCCNPETRKSGVFTELGIDALYSYIRGDMPYFLGSGGGITFSGGEPLFQTDYMAAFINKYCKDISVCLETSLFASEESIRKLIPLIDEWYVDFKIYDEKRHMDYTGVSNQQIKDNLKLLASQVDHERIIITFPMVPDHNLSRSNLESMMSFLQELGLNRIELHPYRKFQEDKHKALGITPIQLQELSKDEFLEIQACFVENGFESVHKEIVRNRDKCRYLKAIRQELKKSRNIPVEIVHCTYEGPCKGTCPQCEYELEVINRYM